MTTQPKKYISYAERKILQIASTELSANEIAQQAEVHIQDVYRTVRKFDLKIRPHEPKLLTKEQQEEIRELASPNVGLAEIARKIKSTPSRVRWFMDKERLPRKTNSVPKTYPKIGSMFFDWRDFENSVI